LNRALKGGFDSAPVYVFPRRDMVEYLTVSLRNSSQVVFEINGSKREMIAYPIDVKADKANKRQFMIMQADKVRVTESLDDIDGPIKLTCPGINEF